MKSAKLSLTLSIIAVILGIIALILALTKQPKRAANNPKPLKTSKSNISIAYVNVDTLVNHYDLYNALMINYLNKQKQYEKQLRSKQMSIQQRSLYLQNQYQKGLITSLTYQQKMQQLQKEAQNIQQWYQEKSQELLQDQQIITQRVMDSVLNAIKVINKNNTYQLILTKGSLLYGDPGLNITDTLINYLNAHVNVNKLSSK